MAKTKRWDDYTLGQQGLWLLFAYALTVFYAVVIAWNVTDIVSNGANFWNVFWLGLMALLNFRSQRLLPKE